MRISDWSSDVCSSDLKYVDTSLDNFLLTLNISAYSFVAVANRARAMMPDGGSLLTLSYYGAEKVIPHYNVMGVAKAALETSVKYLAMDLGPEKIRVNAISAGPIKTLARSEEHTSELQSLMRISYAVFCLKKQKNKR